MYVKEVTVENQVGLHARPATFFIQKANEYKSSIWVEKEERRVNAKSLLGVLSLGIVGFELSPVVWQKVPGGKSAGRVQSPAVRLLVEREQEITAFEGSSQFKVVALFIHDNQEFKAELNQRFDTEKEATEFLEHLKGSSFTVADITKSPGTRNPAAPFTTSTLQQEANSKLGFSSKATMAAAQKLYQAGKITYMRTDSVNLSGQAIANYLKSPLR
jgi:DNA topoisomerase-1